MKILFCFAASLLMTASAVYAAAPVTAGTEATLEAPAEENPGPELMLPAGCALGDECWVVNYVDTDPGADASDFQCGHLTYDGHDGTDIAVRDQAAMRAGVTVLAAADGVVLKVRDEMEDRQPSAEDIQKMLADRKGCGNGILVDHGKGWQTIYCHMRHESILVKEGDKVATGMALGQIGQSGAAEFPHVHLGVLHKGTLVDPFSGQSVGAGCEAEATALWRSELNIPYQPFSFYAAGFSGQMPDFESIKQAAASPETLESDSLELLMFWTALWGLATGDKLHLEIRDPDDKIFAERDIVAEGNKIRQFYYIGKKLPTGRDRKPGLYRGRATLTRITDGQPMTKTFEKAVRLE